MKRISAIVLSVVLTFAPFRSAQADLFGGDVAMLAQILAQTIKQLYELQKVVENGRDTLGMMKDINRGINDSLRLIDSLGPFLDPGVYKDLKRVEQLVRHLQSSYGIIVDSPDRGAQQDTDQVVAEAISLNNSLYDYAKDLDKVGEKIKAYSHDVSPGGAQKLTAQSLGVMVHVMNQQLRATATGLKIQAQALAVQNKKEKQETAAYMGQANMLKSLMKKNEANFTFPRF